MAEWVVQQVCGILQRRKFNLCNISAKLSFTLAGARRVHKINHHCSLFGGDHQTACDDMGTLARGKQPSHVPFPELVLDILIDGSPHCAPLCIGSWWG